MTAKAISEAARALSLRRKTFAGGRPAKLSPCPHCKVPFGAVALREHKPRCPKKPARRRANAAK